MTAGADVESLVSVSGQMEHPLEQGDRFDPATVVWIMDLPALRQVAEAIEACSEIIYDLETTGLNEHEDGTHPDHPVRAAIALAQFTLPTAADPYNRRPTTYLVPLYHPESPLIGHWREALGYLAGVMLRSGKPITGQNLKFDLRWTYAHSGVDLSRQYAWDTQTASHLIDETITTSLKPRTSMMFGVERWDDHDLSAPGAALRVPLIDLGMYGARDTYWTWRKAVAQRALLAVGDEREWADDPISPEEIEQRRLGVLSMWCTVPAGATLTEIEQRGFSIDLDWTREHLAEVDEIAEREKAHLVRVYDTADLGDEPSLAPTSKWFLGWVEKAIEAGDLRVTATTPKGNPQWNKDVLTKQALEGSAVARHLLDYRAATKKGEYLRSWLRFASPAEAIHTTYNIGRVVTGRLSSADPNMQQVTAAIKPAFVPRPGYLVAELDYSQIELRIAAFLSRSKPMLQAYQTGQDLHRLTASRITGVPLGEITKQQRQLAKAVNFGLVYGMGAEGLRIYADSVYGVQMSEQEATDARTAYFATYPELVTWHGAAISRARATGQVVSPIGRVRRLPDIHDGNDRLRGDAERRAINSPVQGFASDLMQIACASITGNLPGHERVPDVHLIGTVHDSVIAEVPADDWKRATARMMRRMMDLDPVLKRLGCTFDVPLAVEATVSTRWGLGDVGIIT